MSAQLNVIVGSKDDDIGIAETVRVLGRGVDVSVTCNVDDGADVVTATALVRQRLERTLTGRPYLKSGRGMIEIPAVPRHMHERIDQERLMTERDVAPLLADFIAEYGGWYAFSQAREEDFRRLAREMDRRIRAGEDTLGVTYEMLLRITLEMARQTLDAGRNGSKAVLLPGVDAEATREACEIIRPALRGRFRPAFREGEPNMRIVDRITGADQAEFDGALILRSAKGAQRVILFDATKAEGNDDEVHLRILEKRERNSRFLFGNVLAAQRAMFSFVTVAAVRDDRMPMREPGVILTDHLPVIRALDSVTIRADQAMTESKYLQFRNLVDRE